jgi:5-(carboxyamino)imidazole ribonucleotide mutase
MVFLSILRAPEFKAHEETVADILILIGSESDREYFADVGKYADYFGVTWELDVISAHRNPDKLKARLTEAEAGGARVLVAGAGMAAHLAGACAAHSILPVIGVPLPGSSLQGFDALLSTVQMPAGVPVATVAVGKAGARNAVILAAQMIALGDDSMRTKLKEFKAKGARL